MDIAQKNKLNRDIKNLLKYDVEEVIKDAQIRNWHHSEYKRLYRLDPKFEYMNKNSIRIMLRLNLLYRIISLHNFGLEINLDEL